MSVLNPPENGDASNSDRFGSGIPRPLNNTKSFRILGDLILRCDDPSDFPDAVQRWFRGQKEILFYARSIHGISDIAEIFRASYIPTNTELASFSLKEMLQTMMSKQIFALGKENGKNQDLYPARFDGQSIETCCHQCNSRLGDDHDSRWSTKRPGFYITRQGACRNCHGKLRTRKPVNASIAWIHGRLEHMRREVLSEELQNRQPSRKGEELWTTCGRKDTYFNRPLPGTIASWCIRCKEKTEHSAGSGAWVDVDPRWTLGDSRPLYIERQLLCRHCKNNGRSSGRFVPVDDTPSIFTHRLTEFAKMYGAYDNVIKAKLLDVWPPS